MDSGAAAPAKDGDAGRRESHLHASGSHVDEEEQKEEGEEGQSMQQGDNKAASFARAFAKIMATGTAGKGILSVRLLHASLKAVVSHTLCTPSTPAEMSIVACQAAPGTAAAVQGACSCCSYAMHACRSRRPALENTKVHPQCRPARA